MVREYALVVGPIAAGAFVMVVVWFSSERTRTRTAYLIAVLGSIAMCFESVLISLCGSGDGSQEARQPEARHWVLLWIPVLFGMAWVVSRTRGSWAWVLYFLLLILALLVPYSLI